MRTRAIALPTLLLGAGLLSSAAQAAVTQGHSAAVAPAATEAPSGVIRLADGAKGGDKYMSGKAGGRYGVGGTERDKAQGSKSKSKSKNGAPQDAKPLEKQQ
jgi:hypothetical protein